MTAYKGGTVRISADILIPTVPNFFRMQDGQSLPVEAVSDHDLKAIGLLWTTNLIEHAKTRRHRTRAMSDDKLVQLADAKMRIDDMVMRVGVSGLEADWVAVCFALKDAELLRKKLHDREALAKVLEEADNQYTKKLITAMQGGPCLRSRNDVLADAIIRYATDTRPR